MALNCFRFLNFKGFDAVNRLTLGEYKLLMQANQLKEVDKAYHIHLQAYANFRVKAERRAGKNKTKPVYGTFRKFFDYKAELKKVNGKKEDRFAGFKAFLRQRGGG